MKFFKTKKGRFISAITILLVVLIVRHIIAENTVFHEPSYEKVNISHTLSKKNLSDKDYDLIFKQTGISPGAAKELIADGKIDIFNELHSLYFKNPVSKKNYIAYPITLEERNEQQKTPVVPLKKGDILVTFNTRTLDWRHGHCGLVLNDGATVLLEHMSIGNTSSKTHVYNWGTYPAFAVLRYPDEKVAKKAAEYASVNLTDIPYSIFAGIIKKDKTGEERPVSHCSHIVWQAYKSQSVDIDSNKGQIVTPRDISLSDKLQVVQIFGINPKKYEDRLLK